MNTKTTIFLLSFVSLLPFLCLSLSNFSACWGFGDILTDTGNNNFIPTFFRSNFRPYGRDFPNGEPTGRFNNGKIPIDFICSGIGLKEFTPPYLDKARTTDRELLTGASFGSGGAGYDPLTPTILSSLSFPAQINLFKEALERLKILVGEEMTKSIVEKSLFMVTSVSADFAFYYDIPIRSTQYNITGYHNFILQQVEDTIRMLYDVGARVLLVSNAPPIGCAPIQITLSGSVTQRECVQQQNDDCFAYNQKFEVLLSNLERALPNSTIVSYDLYNITVDVVGNPAKYGFEVTKSGCCGTGLYEFGPTCITGLATACRNASKYVFWDAFNPTQAYYKFSADKGLEAINSRFSF